MMIKRKKITNKWHKFFVVGLVILTTGSVSLQSIVALGNNSASNDKKVKNEIEKQENIQKYIPGQLIVKYKKEVLVKQDNEFLKKYKIRSSEKIIKGFRLNTKANNAMENRGVDRIHLVKLEEGADAIDIIEKLKKNPKIEYVEQNGIVQTTETIPNDPNFLELWGLHNIGQDGGTDDADIDAPEAWDILTGGSEVIIAVIDTGVDYNHPDLADNIWTNSGEIGTDSFGNDKETNEIDDDKNGFIDDVYGWDFVNDDNNPMDGDNHGTHCSGTIGAVGDDGVGIAGVNWTTNIMPIRFLGPNGGSWADAIASIEYATLMKADIMSNSWGGSSYSYGLYDAISAAGDAGILFVAAAGNNYSNSDQYPAYPASYDLDNIISVAATDRNDSKASFSNWGLTHVDLGAPGVNIYSTLRNGKYGTYSGTSMACPHVAGAAGLIKAQYPNLTSDGLKARLLSGVDIVSSMEGKTVSGGRLNVFNSLSSDNMSPVANAGGTQILSDADNSEAETVTLNGSGSYDPDGNIVSYQWFKSNSTVSLTPIGTDDKIITHSFPVNSDYQVTLIVTDDNGATGTDTATIIINPNQLPVADAGPDQTITVDATVSFDGSDSSDDGNIDSYDWNFGDESEIASGPSVTHVYDTAGTYTVTLTVTDNGGATATDTVDITIEGVVIDDVTIDESDVVYDTKKDTLTIKARSSAGREAVLTASAGSFENIAMRYDSRNNVFKVTIRKIFQDPYSVTVSSSLGGSATLDW